MFAITLPDVDCISFIGNLLFVFTVKNNSVHNTPNWCATLVSVRSTLLPVSVNATLYMCVLYPLKVYFTWVCQHKVFTWKQMDKKLYMKKSENMYRNNIWKQNMRLVQSCTCIARLLNRCLTVRGILSVVHFKNKTSRKV